MKQSDLGKSLHPNTQPQKNIYLDHYKRGNLLK
jgi:hypothetical protein